MPKRKAHALPETFRTVNLNQIATEIGRSRKDTRKLLHRLRSYGVFPRLRHAKQGREILYDARVVDMVKALIEVPHRHVGDGPTWLDHYLGDKHGQSARDPGVPRTPQP